MVALALQRRVGNAATVRLMRKITWQPQGEAYAVSAAGLVERLTSTFAHVEVETIKQMVADIEEMPAKWTPHQAYLGIKRYLDDNFPAPLASAQLGRSTITKEDLENYFLRSFKTMAEITIDDKHVVKFMSSEAGHAEKQMIERIDRFIEEMGWHKDFSTTHKIRMLINNSPCMNCARLLYEWHRRDVFVEFHITFANMYDKERGFTTATTMLRSGGMTVDLASVEKDLLPLVEAADQIAKQKVQARSRMDAAAARDWARWLQKHGDEN
jgi:Secreted Novel AID/APOBEC-like Deaminase 4